MSEKVVERIEKLHENGFSLAINDSDLSSENILKYKKQTNKIKKYIQTVTLSKAKKDTQFFLQTYFGNIASIDLVDKQIIRTMLMF